jgi:hypothetical protein
MTQKPIAYINVEKRTLEFAEPIKWHTPTVANLDRIPLFTKEALAQPEQEPVAWMHVQGNYKEPSFRELADDEVERGWEQYPLYNTPPQRTEQEPVIGKWSLREVYFDEDGEPISHRSPPQRTEPVAHWSDCAVHSEPAYPKGECDCGGIVAVADYTALSDKYVALSDKYVALKAQRTWVGLTNNELQPIADEYRILFGSWVEDFARAIEAKLRSKNGY